jgi:hypothetical protein
MRQHLSQNHDSNSHAILFELVLCCCQLEILENVLTWGSHFHFIPGPAHSTDSFTNVSQLVNIFSKSDTGLLLCHLI